MSTLNAGSLKLPIKLEQRIDQLERGYILTAMRKARGVKAHAARMLGINRTTLVAKIRKHGWVNRGKNEW